MGLDKPVIPGQLFSLLALREYSYNTCNLSSKSLYGHVHYDLRGTVEPPNKGHFGNGSFVLCLEVVPISEVQLYNPQIMF